MRLAANLWTFSDNGDLIDEFDFLDIDPFEDRDDDREVNRLTIQPFINWNALVKRRLGVYIRRMPRMQVYLPDDLYALVKARGLPASELLQEAVRAEVRRQDLLARSDEYLADLVTEVGEPSTRHRARARRIAERIGGRTRRKVS